MITKELTDAPDSDDEVLNRNIIEIKSARDSHVSVGPDGPAEFDGGILFLDADEAV